MWNILEPVMTVEINAPEEYKTVVIQNIMKRNAIIQGTDSVEGFFTLFCEVTHKCNVCFFKLNNILHYQCHQYLFDAKLELKIKKKFFPLKSLNLLC